MLTILTVILSILLLSLTVMQAVYVFRYQRIHDAALNAYPMHLPSDQPSRERALAEDADVGTCDTATIDGHTALILCLRGADPTLDECLTGILSQNHANFQLYCVFDDPTDPAVEYIQEFFQGKRLQPTMHFVTERPTTCTLKCSALISVIQQLPPEVQFVALIDADAVADENWLIDLLSPFSDPMVGATTGNRWFSPVEHSVGSTFRKIWNAAAAPQVVLYNIGWGGTLAFRREVIEQAGLLARWRHAFCEDTMTQEALASIGMRLQRVPTLVMENTESTTLHDATGWIARQMLTVRLHHKSWPLLLSHGILTAIACYIVPLIILLAWISGDFSNAGTLVRYFLLYQIFNLCLLMVIDRVNRRVLALRDFTSADESADLGRRTPFFQMMLATGLNQYLFPPTVYRAWKTKLVRWRGIEYQIDGDNRLRMKQFVPYREVISLDAEPNSAASIV